MENKNLESIYAEEIHPLVERIALIGRQTGMPMFLTFQESNSGYRTTCLNYRKSNYQKLKWHMYIEKSWTLDNFFSEVIRDAECKGHSSLYLKAMGIPTSVSDSKMKYPVRR